MIRTLGSLLFYARFLRSFSALGYQRRLGRLPALAPNFSGQRWLVTGATGGIGRAVALAASGSGATVLALARDAKKLEDLQNDADPPERIVPVAIDLASLRQIRALAESTRLRGSTIDVLVNNVGVLCNRFRRTGEDLETSFVTNLLGPFVLTERLYDSARLSVRGSVINVSSGGMYGSALRLDAMDCRDASRFDGMAAYAMHKRAQVVLTRYWNEQWRGRPAVHVMHPGWVDTEGVRTALPGFRAALKRVLRNADQGADTILWLAMQRPPIAPEGGIWLDRALHPEHEFAFTRATRHTPEALAAFLRERAGVRLDR